MKCLSLWQPWASLWMEGIKEFETGVLTRTEEVAMGYLNGLEGMPPRVRANYVRSRTHAVQTLRERRNIVAAGDTGALTVWRPRGGGFIATFHRHCVELSRERFGSRAALTKWLKAWWPHLHDGGRERN